MEQIKVKESAGYALKAEAEEREDELFGALQRRQSSRATKNFEVTAVSADLGWAAGIGTASSNVSTITNEEHEPAETEPGRMEWAVQRGVNYGDGSAAEGDGGHGIGEVVAEDQLQQSVFSEKENGRSQTTQKVQAPPSDEHENSNFPDARLLSPTEPYEDEDGVPFTEEFDPEETEYDVEMVLKKQNTHDLICPKCDSCITRRVILRRKVGWRRPGTPRVTIPKGAAQSPAEEVTAPGSGAPTGATKGAEEVTAPGSGAPTGATKGAEEVAAPGSGAPTGATKGAEEFAAPGSGGTSGATEGHRCPEVFQCLSCLTFFIPTGNAQQGQQPPAPMAGKCSCFPFFPWKPTPPVPEAEDETDPPPATWNIDVLEEPDKKSTGAGVTATTNGASASRTTLTGHTQADKKNPPQAAGTETGTEDQPLLREPTAAEVHGTRDFNVLKSIVYGGLVESIASLGVVSSAAGGGAATLNTFALALANLVGGLLVLINNLRELKKEHSGSGQARADSEEEGRYYQELGKGRFSLHAMLAVVSYLVFGLVAPITYGFSFRESDNRNYKLAAVAAACLPCILLLALGKAYVRSESYIKTALYYLTMGVTAAGISFLVGELVDWLLERLGLFTSESSSSSALVSGGLGAMMSPSRSGWASY